MELNEYNAGQLDAIKQAGNQEDPYMKRQYAAIEQGLARQQKIGEEAEEAFAKLYARQISLASALREYKKGN